MPKLVNNARRIIGGNRKKMIGSSIPKVNVMVKPGQVGQTKVPGIGIKMATKENKTTKIPGIGIKRVAKSRPVKAQKYYSNGIGVGY